ncbi:MAG: LPS export ABC transporter periplasmic protein LptC [Vampirovibrio sp.]|nr:LPS export ABC transporter periplasmic protein LptC [Vampirovibrio sp.]
MKLINSRIIFVAVLAALVIGIGWWLFQPPPDMSELPQIEDSTTDEDVPDGSYGEDASFIVTRGDTKVWEIRADKSVLREDNGTADLSGVEGEFFNDSGNAVITFKAPTGNYNNKKNAVMLHDGVTIQSINNKGQRLTAPTVTWSLDTDRITASGGVTLARSGSITSRAQRCNFTLDFNSVVLKGNVQTLIH